MTINFAKIIGTLKKINVPFVIIGGHAVIQHGYIRATEDVDIVFQRNNESEKKLFSALKDLLRIKKASGRPKDINDIMELEG